MQYHMQYTHFSKSERLELSILLEKGYSLRRVARSMRRNPSSVSREIKDNSVNGVYDPLKANHKAGVRRHYAKYQGMKIVGDDCLRYYVEEGMRRYWSPEKIAGRLKRETHGRQTLHHTTIYKYLYSVYGECLCWYLRSKRHRPRKRPAVRQRHEIIKNRVFIDQRPAIINERQRFGDYEGDTMGRPKHASAATLVVLRERQSRRLFATKVRRLAQSMEGFQTLLRPLPTQSLTLDNGVENQHYAKLGIQTYFCHPYSSWEKGSVEQGIGCLRQFIPKRSDLKDYTPTRIRAILKTINNTPMKCLGYRTPNEVFKEHAPLPD